MKSVVVAFISLLIVFPALATSGSCGQDVFLGKVCVSEQSLPLDGNDMAKLQCEDAAKYPGIYSTLKEAFVMAPSWFQNRLCQIDRLGVYKPVPETVLSWSYSKDNGFIGVSKIRMDQGYDFKAHAATMMKQAKKFKTIPEGTIFPASFAYQAGELEAPAAILYLLAHEVGHLLYNPLDPVARRASFHDCNKIFGSLTCPNFTESQFGHIDWVTGQGELNTTLRGEIRPQHQALRSFILADASVSHTPEKADTFFRSLHASSFVSPFALYSPEEDFCETLAHLVMAESAKAYEFHYLSGEKVSVWDRVLQPQTKELHEKIRFIQRHTQK